MALFSRRREEKPADFAPPAGPASVTAATTVATLRDRDLGAPPLRFDPRDSTAMSQATTKPTGPTPVMATGPTPPAGSAIPPRPTPVGMPGMPTPPGTGPLGAPGAAAPAPRAGTAERRTLVVGRGISLQGTVAEAERLVVEGTVESQMIQAAELSIGHSGVFKGEVQVEDAEIAGTFDGTLTARGALVLRATGRLLGVARYGRLMVEEGGQISGKMEKIGEGAPAPRPVPAEV
jgi:cytoskeletal protein CcmA (bactofilin family)